jgi:hypothetical protein
MIFRKTTGQKSRLLRPSGAATRRTSAPLESLERRVVFSVSPAEEFSSNTANQLSHLSPTTCGCPGCSAPSPAAIVAMANTPAMPAQAPLADTFKLHSLASATKRIYLDFDGHTTNDPAWNNGTAFTTPAYSIDATPTFSDTELQNIQEVWARVAEDFSPFEVDVTTEEPALADLRNLGAGDTRWGMRVVIGGSGDWYPDALGVALLPSFNLPTDTPCFVFAGQSWNNNLNLMATVVSHEVGHTLGLDHDGQFEQEYYGGRGTGSTSWGPIMGNPNFINLTQWSRGQYGGSTNTEDDLAIITTRNGFGYRQDDHGSDLASARVMSADTITGIIERNTDLDVFQFFVAGSIQASIKPIAVGANLDVLAEILDSSGSVIATSNPVGAIDASFSLTVAPGQYYLRVQGTGEGDPLQTGYTDYGSLGQYTVEVKGVVTEPIVLVENADVTEGNEGEVEARFTIRLLTAAVTPVTVAFATRDGSATIADEDYLPVAGTVVFAPGELAKTVVVKVRGDTWRERDETFELVVSRVVGGVIGDGAGTGVIRNDDTRVGVQLLPAAVVETTGSLRAVLEYTVLIKGTTDNPFTLLFETRNGTAVAGRDFRPTSGQIMVRPGQDGKRIAVSVVGDAQMEPDETVMLAVRAVGANNVDVFAFDGGVVRQSASEVAGVILDDDSRFFTIQSVNSTVVAGGSFQFQVGLRRRPGYGEALPLFTEFGSLPGAVREAMAAQIRFSVSFMSGHTPTVGIPRRPKVGAVDFRIGTVSIGYGMNQSGEVIRKDTDTLEILTDAVASRRSLVVQLFNPANAMLAGMTVARGTVTPSVAAAFSSLASSAPAPRSRLR